ncbi:Hypothetical predicted protein [Cloeon dipterum]|uniref:Uncharacterized protein n=1 Tax=Cloeon dipterum TaxID=197152 RepID=A0A8S1CF46_9INSE|nr:Hypothetical predicted protein [Cloeon dipterum]
MRVVIKRSLSHLAFITPCLQFIVKDCPFKTHSTIKARAINVSVLCCHLLVRPLPGQRRQLHNRLRVGQIRFRLAIRSGHFNRTD